MKTPLFQSSLAPKMQSFLEVRRAMGQKALATQHILQHIDRFLANFLCPGQPITREIFHQWLKTIERLSVAYRRSQICIFRQFCRYLHHFDQRTHLVPDGLAPRRTSPPIPYIYTNQQIRNLMVAAKQLRPKGSFRSVMISTLIGLLYSTGLRVGEALKLTLGDVDLKRRILLIRQTKFRKSRLVPISTSTAKSLRVFLELRLKNGFPTIQTAPVFVKTRKKGNGKPYRYDCFGLVFLKILRDQKIRGPKRERGPRIHDLRHSFAVHRLTKWYREGVVLSAKLPLLSTYLGHASLTDTEVYLQANANLLEEANKRFHSNCPFSNLLKGSKGNAHVH